ELTVDAGVLPPGRVADEVGQGEALDLGGEGGWVFRGVEAADGPDAGLAGQLRLERVLDVVPQGRDGSHAGDDDAAAAHFRCSPFRSTSAAHCPMLVKLILRANGLVTGRGLVLTATGHSGSGVS